MAKIEIEEGIPGNDGPVATCVSIRHNIVAIDFERPVHWIGFAIDEVRAFAKMLLDHADELERRQS